MIMFMLPVSSTVSAVVQGVYYILHGCTQAL